MHAGRHFSIWLSLNWLRKYIFIFLIYDALVIVFYHYFHFEWLIVPWQPLSLVGIAVAFYLGFKNNSSYERLWEARKIWGGIVNTSRSFTVMVRDFVTDEFSSEELTDEELKVHHKRIVYKHIAWLRALTIQLRQPKPWEHLENKDLNSRTYLKTSPDAKRFEKLKEYLSSEDYDYVMKKGNHASHLLSLQSIDFKELKRADLLDNFRHMELEKLIVEMYTLQGKSERIKNFPFPRQYASANYFFVVLFIFLLPYGMLSIFQQATVPALFGLCVPLTVICSWVFWFMHAVGDYSENPFEGLHNDVPINNIAETIEVDIRQMLEEDDLKGIVAGADEYDILV